MRKLLCKLAMPMGALGVVSSPAAAAGLPQLDPTTYAPQVVWLVITFAVLYFLMAKVALPRITNVLEERQTRIEGNLEKAGALRAQAQTTAEAYEKSLVAARQAAQAVLTEARDRIAADSAAKQAELGERLAGEITAAEARIVEAKQAALDDIRKLAGEVAESVSQKLTGETPDTKTVGKVIDAVLKERR